MAPKGAVGGGPATLQQKSPAEFFAENKNIAGFDNVRQEDCTRRRRRAVPCSQRSDALSPPQKRSPSQTKKQNQQPGKCLYTTVRELVENSLDSAESVSALPLVEITM